MCGWVGWSVRLGRCRELRRQVDARHFLGHYYQLRLSAPSRASCRRVYRRGFSSVRSWLLSVAAIAIGTACSQAKPVTPPTIKVVRDTVTVRDPELDKRATRLELQLLARDAQIEDLQVRLEDTRAEVVRAMAKLQSVASRAQAASSMAEAAVALQTMKVSAGQDDPPELNQVTRLVRQAATEFDKQNYGGALYLANQAKTLVSAYRGRLAVGGRESARPG